MFAPPLHPTLRRTRDLIAWAAVLAVLGLPGGLSSSASATSVSVALKRGPEAKDPGHDCKCKSCRGASSCCCARAAEFVPKPRSAPPMQTVQRATFDPGPCLESAPCGGGEGLPDSASGIPLGRLLVLSPTVDFRAEEVDRPFLAMPPTLRSTLPSSLLDDPPEPSSTSRSLADPVDPIA